MSQINPFKGYATPDLMLSELLGDAYEFLKPLHSNLEILSALGMSINELRAIYDGFIAGDGIQAKIAILLAGFENFFGTFAEAIAARPVGTYFTTNASGKLKIYQRTDVDPFYIELSASTQPVTWDDFTWDELQGKPDHFDIDPSELEAIVSQAQSYSEDAASAAEVAIQARSDATDRAAEALLAMEAAAESRDAAGQHAGAASGFLVQAQTAVTDAGEWAQAAQEHATNADTSRSNAYTSEQAASQSKTDAEEAKALAFISAQAAAAAANQAGEQAEAAAGWASHAESKATEAVQNASAALLAQTKAETASAQAESFLEQMAEAGSGDDGASAAAALSAQVAAAAATTSLNASGNEDFNPQLGTKGWYTTWNGTTPLPNDVIVSTAWEGNAYLYMPPREHNIFSAKIYPVDTSRRYRIRTKVGAWLNGSGGTPSVMYIGFVGLDAAGNAVDHGAFGSFRYAAMVGEAVNDGQLITREAIITGEGNDSWTKFPPGTKQIKLVGIFGYQGTSTCINYCDYLKWEDIDAVKQAEGHANAASGFKDTASAKATEAGISAQAAHQEFLNAQAQVGLAANQAQLANDSRVLADQAAASASSSSLIAASVGGATLNKNPVFNAYPNAGAGNIPTNWDIWESAARMQRTTGMFASPYAISMIPQAGENVGVKQSLGSNAAGVYVVKPGDKLVLEADVTLHSGELKGSGVLVQYWNHNHTIYIGENLLDFFTDPDVNGTLIGSGAAGRTYSFRKVVEVPVHAESIVIYAMGNWSGFQNSLPPKNLSYHRAGVRPANSAEALEAYVRQSAGAAAYAAGRSSAWLKQEVNAGAAGAFVSLNAETDSPAQGDVTLITKTDAPNNNLIVLGRTIIKTGSSNAWSSGAFSKEASTTAAYAEAQAIATNRYVMFGFSRNPRASAHYSNQDYGIYLAGNGNVYVQHGNDQFGPYGTYNVNDIFSLKYLSGAISYRKNGKEFAFTTAGLTSTETFHFNCVIHDGGGVSGLKNINFAAYAPTQASAVSMGAREIHLLNEVDGTYKKAMSVVGGEVKVYGKLSVGISPQDLQVGLRGAATQDIYFEADPANNRVTWTAGVIFWTDDNGAVYAQTISAGSCVASAGHVYVSFQKQPYSAAPVSLTAVSGISTGFHDKANHIPMAVYEGGIKVTVHNGQTIINGGLITTHTVGAQQVVTQGLITSAALINDAVIKNANIENLTIGADKVQLNGINKLGISIVSNEVYVAPGATFHGFLPIPVNKDRAESNLVFDCMVQVSTPGNLNANIILYYYLAGNYTTLHTSGVSLDANGTIALPIYVNKLVSGYGAGYHDFGLAAANNDGSYLSIKQASSALVREVKR